MQLAGKVSLRKSFDGDGYDRSGKSAGKRQGCGCDEGVQKKQHNSRGVHGGGCIFTSPSKT